jgi:hypothetical protein
MCDVPNDSGIDVTEVLNTLAAGNITFEIQYQGFPASHLPRRLKQLLWKEELSTPTRKPTVIKVIPGFLLSKWIVFTRGFPLSATSMF